MSLRRRLVVGFVVVAAVLVVTNAALTSIFESVLLDRIDRQLADVASRPVLGGDRRPGARGPGPGAESATLSEYFIAVGDGAAWRELSSGFADEDRPSPALDWSAVVARTDRGGPPAPFTVSAIEGDADWRLVAVPNQRGVTVVGIYLDEVAETVRRIQTVQILGTVAVLAALGLVSWWMLRLGVHPIEDMARTADAIAGGDLSHRVDHPGERTEVGRLGVALNAMLERIQEAFRAREASEERVRRFAADASHELRTPLTSIRGYAELWRAGGLTAEGELPEAMRRMEEEATRMGALVDDLLLLARLDQRRPLDRSPVRLDLVAADAVRDARAVEPDRPVELEAASAVVVAGDEMRLRQVAANLLANVRVHTPPGAPVTVRVTSDGGRARLEVEDHGPGMAPDVASQVFERFFRADPSRARSAGGSGLGLSIVSAIAEAHGGAASVTSEVGHGSRFVVDLPCA